MKLQDTEKERGIKMYGELYEIVRWAIIIGVTLLCLIAELAVIAIVAIPIAILVIAILVELGPSGILGVILSMILGGGEPPDIHDWR